MTVINGSFTRPADTTAYAVGDHVANSTSAPAAIEFAKAARVAGGSGYIVNAKLTKSANGNTGASFRLWLYTGQPGSIPNDNAALAQSWANSLIRLGYIDFTAGIVGSDCVTFVGAPCFDGMIPFELVSGQSLYGLLQAQGAYAPASGEQFLIKLFVVQD